MQIENSRFMVSGSSTPDLLTNLISTIEGCRLRQKPAPGMLNAATLVTVRCVDKKPVVEAVVDGETKTFNVSKRDYQRLWDWHQAQSVE